MKKIIYIAKNELYTLFYSPIAWILIILFLLLTSADYIAGLDHYLEYFEKGGGLLFFTEKLTGAISSHQFGYIWGVLENLYMFFPLITMGLLSRETSSGTIKLLYSSPVRIREIVLGKYLAIVCFIFWLVIVLGIIAIALGMSVSNADYGQLVATTFGLFMVLCTYAAVGLFISSLTSYQIVAAIITLGVFALFSKIKGVGAEIDIVRDITFYMNISDKSDMFLRGLLNLRDFTSFLIFIGSFLMFTIIRMRSSKEYISTFKKIMRYAAVIVVAVVLGYITNRAELNVYYDATRAKEYTITHPTQALLAKMDDGELEITAFGNMLDNQYNWRFDYGSQNNIKRYVWEPYIRFKPDIKLKFVHYYDADSTSSLFLLSPGHTLKEIAAKQAETYNISLDKFLSPEEVHKLVDTKAEAYRCFFQLKYKGKTTIVRTFDDPRFWPMEDEIAAGIKRLIATTPKIGFLSDEIERSPFSERPRDYKRITSQLSFRKSLINQGYDFDTISLKLQSIPEGLATLVLADPRTPINPESLEKINNYIDAGGNLFILTEPDRKEVIKPVLEKLGLSLRDGMLIEPNANVSSDCAFALLTATAKNISPQFARILQDAIRYFGDTLFRVAMVGASAIDYQQKDNFRVEPLLYSNGKTSWNRVAPINADSLNLEVEKLPTDEQGSFVMGVQMTRAINGREQRIIVMGDADCFTASQLNGYRPTRYNSAFSFSCFSYFSYGEFPANTIKPPSFDNSFKITADDVPTQKLVLFGVIPILIGIAASVILIRRKRK